MFRAQDSDLPGCFGQLWDPKEPACMGGPDATYSRDNGGRLRPVCAYQQSCSIRTQATRYVPASSLLRSSPPEPIRPAAPPALPPRPALWSAPTQHTAPTNTHQLASVNALPPYLSVREPLGAPRMKRLLIEVLRSMGKSFGHTLANFFDSESFSTRE